MSEKSPRMVALDLVKGGLVLCMVAYHSLNYSTQYKLGFAYMAFLPPSFILIAGFLFSHLYTNRVTGGEDSVNLRLIGRGLKIVGIFTLLNLGIAIFLSGGPQFWGAGLREFFEHAFDIYMWGSARYADFVILLPIGYLLILGPCLLNLEKASPWFLPIVAFMGIVALSVLEQKGIMLVNASLVWAGVLGVLLGRIPRRRIESIGGYWKFCLLAYVAYALFSRSFGQTYAMQLVGACLAIAVLYSLSIRFARVGWVQNRLVTLGQYSLVAYIWQIAVLQIVVRLFGRSDPWSAGFWGLLVVTLAATMLMVEFLQWIRCRSRGMDGLYRTVFA